MALLAVGTFVPRPLFGPPAAEPGQGRRAALLLSNPIHTDIALPADADVVQAFSFLLGAGLPVADPAVEWIVVGWGSRAFYTATPTWSELRPGPLFRALTLDRSVMRVALAGEIRLDDPAVRVLAVEEPRFVAMLDQILASFVRDGGMPVVLEGEQYGLYDRFYEARGWFNVLLGCNVWTGAMLRAAGLRTGLWNPLPQSLGWSLDLYNGDAVQASGSQP